MSTSSVDLLVGVDETALPVQAVSWRRRLLVTFVIIVVFVFVALTARYDVVAFTPVRYLITSPKSDVR
jgi:hypothetical protein